MTSLACPYCGRVNEVHDHPEGAKPKPGDVSICWGCRKVGIFTEDGIRQLSGAERDAIRRDPDVQAALGAVAESYTPSQAVDLLRGPR